ncbi:MAG: hypothetical protein LH618_13530, partial [Saprospiraceae bacterium]|nr:hypothetical protein [Saprospiraceae bacterium]
LLHLTQQCTHQYQTHKSFQRIFYFSIQIASSSQNIVSQRLFRFFRKFALPIKIGMSLRSTCPVAF